MITLTTFIVTAYLTGAVAAFILGLYLMFTNDDDNAEYGMVAPMMFMSWTTIFAYCYGLYENHNV